MTFNEVLVDTFCAKLVTDPNRFDVVVTSNQFGDIITDLGAALVGGLGLAPGLCAGATHAMSQATHGSAPDIAGKGIAFLPPCRLLRVGALSRVLRRSP